MSSLCKKIPSLSADGNNHKIWMIIMKQVVSSSATGEINHNECFVIGSRARDAQDQAPCQTVNVLGLDESERGVATMRGMSGLSAIQWTGWYENRAPELKRATQEVQSHIFMSIDPSLLCMVQHSGHPAITFAILCMHFSQMTPSLIVNMTEKMCKHNIHDSRFGNSWNKFFSLVMSDHSRLQGAGQGMEEPNFVMLIIRALKQSPTLKTFIQVLEADQQLPMCQMSTMMPVNKVTGFLQTNGGDKIKHWGSRDVKLESSF